MSGLFQMRTQLAAVVIAALSTTFCACNTEGYFLDNSITEDGGNPGDDGGGDDGGGGGDDGGGTDADNCVPTQEVCDEVDNDCDGMIDEGFNLDADPANCGSCGATCDKFGTVGTCEAGSCGFACRTGFVDLNDDINVDGCEYQCTPTSSDDSDRCDLSDNDCDGSVDEDTDTDSDLDNCGGCGNICVVLNSDAVCDMGTCTQGTCDEGFLDVLPAVPGCEYECPVFPAQVEICNSIDDNCDGLRDNDLGNFDHDGNPDAAANNSCHPFFNDADGGNDTLAGVGACALGSWSCTGTLTCQNYGLPQAADFCDTVGPGADADCDGQVDEDTDTATDPNNCGSCGAVCNLPNVSTALCSTGGCKVGVCDAGFINFDGVDSTGCDYECTPTGPEVCDGIDNDCDKLVDTDDPDLIIVGNFCNQIGPCADDASGNSIAPVCGVPGSGDLAGLPGTCATQADWFCPYDTTVVTVDSATCVPETQETNVECDGLDNNCDGLADEIFTDLGSGCDDGKVGACLGTGEIACAGDGVGTFCDITNPGLATPADFESCNGKDDNCDGVIDEDAVDDMVPVNFTPASSCTEGNPCANATGTQNGTCEADASCTYWVDQYEASRPDSTESSVGADKSLACSLGDKMPWGLVTQTEAESACAANGKSLCTADEWQLACEGAAGNLYPYVGTYDPFTCNAADWNDDCLPPGADTVEQAYATGYGYSPGGSAGSCPVATDSGCVSEFGAVDMSGNLREWTGTQVAGSYEVRGGSYTEPAQGATCDNDFIKLSPSTALGNIGFRCCRSDEPPLAP